jgi:hypothetical protein
MDTLAACRILANILAGEGRCNSSPVDRSRHGLIALADADDNPHSRHGVKRIKFAVSE